MVFGHENEVNGIVENSLDRLILDVCDCADNLNGILNSIDEEIYILLGSVTSSVSNQFVAVYEEMKKNYKVVNENILSYGTDYAKVKNAYIDRNSSMVRQVENAAQSVRQTSIYEEGR